jgi:oxygen-dependent protoporphyrinogen oxidase
MGADSFITNKPWALDLCRRLGLEERLIPTDERFRRSLVLRKGQPVPVPEGFTLMAPARLWPIIATPIFSPWGKLRMGLEAVLPLRRSEAADESLASFVRRRFGREALERLAQPLVGGIYTSDPEKLSLRATLPRFLEMEREHGSVIRALRCDARRQPHSDRKTSGARYGLFTTPAGGISELLDALAQRVTAVATIRTSTSVRSISPLSEGEEQRWQLSFQDGTVDDFDAVILAVPARQAADLVASSDGALAAELRAIEYASSAIVVTGHKLSDVNHPLDASGLVIPAIERRRVIAVSFASRKFPGRAPEGRVLLRTFVGGAMQPEMLERSDDALIELVRDELRDILNVRGAEEFAVVARYDRAMPQYHVGHLERVARIERLAEAHPGLALAGNAYRGVSIPDCIHSGELAAERIAGTSRLIGNATASGGRKPRG